MFPQVGRREIIWDLQRNGGSVSATTERILGRGLDAVSASVSMYYAYTFRSPGNLTWMRSPDGTIEGAAPSYSCCLCVGIERISKTSAKQSFSPFADPHSATTLPFLLAAQINGITANHRYTTTATTFLSTSLAPSLSSSLARHRPSIHNILKTRATRPDHKIQPFLQNPDPGQSRPKH